MNRQRLEEVIREELGDLDEGWRDRWDDLKGRLGFGEKGPATDSGDDLRMSDSSIRSGPFAGRVNKSLTNKERWKLGCYQAAKAQGGHAYAMKRCKIEPPAEETPETKETPAPEPGPAPSADQAGDVGDTIPISGTELTIIQQIAKKRGNDIFAVVRQTIEDLGAAQRHPEVGPIIKAFKGDFFKKLKDLNKRTNIAVAESLDEQDEKMTKRQRAAMKGRLRGGRGAKNGAAGSGGAAYAYVRGQGGKAPMLVRNLQANLEKAFMNPSEEEIFDAASEAGATIKDPKEKKKYEDSILKQLEKNPQKRIAIYNENAAELVKVIAKMASDSLTKVVPQKERRKLPEGLQEKVLKAITEALLKK